MDIGGWLRSLGLEMYEAAFHHLLRCRPPWITPPGLNQGFSRWKSITAAIASARRPCKLLRRASCADERSRCEHAQGEQPT